jgi:hypothetical protein
VVAWSTGPEGQEPEDRAWTSPDDAFQLDGLRAGRYDLTAHTGDGRVAVLRGVLVGAGETVEGLVLPLQDGARLLIRYDGKERYGRFTILSEGSAVAVNTVHTGTTRLVTVPPGPVAVEFTVAGRLVERRALDTHAGAETEVSFTHK